MSDHLDDRDQRCDYAEVFVCLIEQAFRMRRIAHEKTLERQNTSEVCGALLARQVTLAKHLAYTPSFWSIHVAPLILRCMTDININLAWISQEAEPRSKQFIGYGLGQAKLNLEHRRAMTATEGTDNDYSGYIDAMESWISMQRIEELVDVNLASWSGKSTRQMARESNCEELYEFEYLPMTKLSHIDWMSIFRLHPISFEGYDPEYKHHQGRALDGVARPNELYLATKMMIQTFDWYDAATGYSMKDTLRLKRFRDHIRLIDISEIKESFSNRFTVEPISGNDEKDFQYKLGQFLGVIRKKTISGIQLRASRIRDTFHEPDVKAVLVPILDRMTCLMDYCIGVPSAWNAHIAPITLRALAEMMLLIVWLFSDLIQRSRQFIDASILQAHNDVSCLEKALNKRAFSSDVPTMRDILKSRIQSLERLFPRERNKNGLPDLRTMAKSGGYLDYYRLEISEWSACVHSSWHHVGFYNLLYCKNALHKFHRLPVVAPLKCDLRYLRSAMKCCQNTLDFIDSIPIFTQYQRECSLLEIFDRGMKSFQTVDSRGSDELDSLLQYLAESPSVHPIKGASQRISEQLEWMCAAATRGDSEAQFLLAQAHWNGFLSDSDSSEAVRLLIQAAVQGHVYAQFHLARIHALGPEEYRDLGKALVWLIRIMTLADVDAELEDKVIALRMEVASKLSVEQLSKARERALSDAI